MHVAEGDVEAAVDEALGPGAFTLLVDLGTGTGRMLELFAPRAARALGFDLQPRHADLRPHEARPRRASSTRRRGTAISTTCRFPTAPPTP